MLQHTNDRFLRAIWREPLDHTPIWMMRQAGRYLPEYRKIREQAGSFMSLCGNPELASEVTLQPLRRYALDAAIIFSDILVIPDALGLGLEFKQSEGPFFERPIKSQQDILNLPLFDTSKLDYVYKTIALVTKELAGKLPLIGFCGSPWTLACYMLQGRSAPGFPTALEALIEVPDSIHQLLTRMSLAVSQHLNEQIKAGCNAVMIFDTWGGLLTDEQYQQFSLHYIKQIIMNLLTHYNNKKIPVILFTKGGSKWLLPMSETGCDVIGVDWTISMKTARSMIDDKVALQGNMDPACLLTSPAEIRAEVARILDSYGHGAGHVFNLGHGITPLVPPEHVSVLVDAVHELSVPYHSGTATKGYSYA